ncbi:hypothetical protein JXF06_003848 [Salmonella enterica subsp. enterica serovar Bredeney]|nr:hypothetical protein [Salmonella enterica subsp. enterica serovar Bredeney]EDS3915386.1 hypothetical protein [Salmonella enterica subsp. enterica]EHB3666845.1 hypothetical protein [Salmonella enterica subsp. enterica serovar Bredeney]
MANNKTEALFDTIIQNVVSAHKLGPYSDLEHDVKRDVICRALFIYSLELYVYNIHTQHPVDDYGNILSGISLVKYLMGKTNPPGFYSDALTHGDVIRILYDSVVIIRDGINMNYIAEIQGHNFKSRLPFYPEKEWIPGLAVEMLS